MTIATRRILGCLLVGLKFLAFSAACFVIFAVIIMPYHNICEAERKAFAGDPESERVLAYNYQSAPRSPECSWGRFAPDKRKAMRWLEAAAKGGDPDAIYHLPHLYEQDFPGERNAEVVTWYKASARHGDPDSAKRLSEIFTKGQLGQLPDPKEVVYWNAVRGRRLFNETMGSIEDSAKYEDDVNAAILMKDAYTYGRFGKRLDKEKAAKWEVIRWQDKTANISDIQKSINADGDRDSVKQIEEAARLGNPDAAKVLADIDATGQLDQPRNPTEAAYWEAVSQKNSRITH